MVESEKPKCLAGGGVYVFQEEERLFVAEGDANNVSLDYSERLAGRKAYGAIRR